MRPVNEGEMSNSISYESVNVGDFVYHNPTQPNLRDFDYSVPANPTRKVNFLMGISIFFMPYIFAWFTLKEGYSTSARKLSFGWLAFVVVYYVFLFGYILPNQEKSQIKTETNLPAATPRSFGTPAPTPDNPVVWVAGCKDGYETGKRAKIDAFAEGNGSPQNVAMLGAALVEITYKGADKDIWSTGWSHGWATAYNIHSPYSRYRPKTAEEKKERIARACSKP